MTRPAAATAVAILALIALLLTPFIFRRHVAGVRLGITESFEPAREAAGDVRLALAREVGAIRGFLLTRDPALLAEYQTARSAEDVAFSRLSPIAGLDSVTLAAVAGLEQAAGRWNAFNDSLASGHVASAAALDRLPLQQAKYRAALESSERLDRSISRSMSDIRTRIEDAERMWAIASAALAIVAAAAAGLVTMMFRAAARQTTLARTDPLTGLYNRRGFDELAQRELRRSRRNATSITLLTFDIDGFKAVNDQRGHAAGDQLLVTVAEAITDAIRDVDLAARLGGDEFVVLLTDNKATPPAYAVERVRDAITSRIARDEWPVTLSLGAVTVRDGAADIDTLIGEADAMMYEVKKSGKNAFRHMTLSQPPATTDQ